MDFFFTILFFLFIIGIVFARLLIIIDAFKKKILWGISVLIFPVWIIFCIKYWRKEKYRLFIIIFLWLLSSISFSTYKMSTGSMQPTLHGSYDYGIGDHLIVNKLIYGAVIPFTHIRLPIIRKPKRGDLIVFQYPKNPKVYYVKRCIGLPGETLEIKNKNVYINGKLLDEPWLKKYPKDKYFIDKNNILQKELSPRDNFGPITIQKNCYFVMGDSRDNSSDSRFWGVLRYKYLRGKVISIYWPFNRIGIVHI